MSRLNYHHLHYFWAVATRRAPDARCRPSCTCRSRPCLRRSSSSRTQLGQPLFTRSGRTLQLTEAGRAGAGLCRHHLHDRQRTGGAAARRRTATERQVLRIGAVATLSRNFQENFVAPLLRAATSSWCCSRAAWKTCWRGCACTHSTWCCRTAGCMPMPTIPGAAGASRASRSAWSASRAPKRRAFRFPDDLAEVPLAAARPRQRHPRRLRPAVRAARPALPRAGRGRRHGDAAPAGPRLRRVALLPTVVVRDELQQPAAGGVLPSCRTCTRASTPSQCKRHFEPPLLKALLGRDQADVLGMAG